jgi:hypothetical protein
MKDLGASSVNKGGPPPVVTLSDEIHELQSNLQKRKRDSENI